MSSNRLSEVNETLRAALRFAQTDPRKALALLQAGVIKCRDGGDFQGLSILARHAGVICTHLGDLRGASRYYEEAISGDPDNPYLQLASGSTQQSLGNRDQARAAFSRCLELATNQGDTEVAAMAAESIAILDKDDFG